MFEDEVGKYGIVAVGLLMQEYVGWTKAIDILWRDN
jgi:hypothetical protein